MNIPKGLVKQARKNGRDEQWVTFSLGHRDAGSRHEADDFKGGGLARMAKCMLPTSEKILKKVLKQVNKFKEGSWIYENKTEEINSSRNEEEGPGNIQTGWEYTCTAYWVYEQCWVDPQTGEEYGCTQTVLGCSETERVPSRDDDDDNSGPPLDGGGSNAGDPCAPGPNGEIPIDCVEELIKIIVDESFEDTKAECVYEKLNQNSMSFRDVIDEFAGENTTFDLKLSVGDLDDYGTLNSSLGDNTFEMIIDQSGLSRTPLEIAGTFLHEGIHAEMRRFLYGATNTSTLPGFPGDFSSDWDNYVLEKYGDLNEPVTAAEHQAMAEKYIGIIADGLQEFDNDQLVRESYEALAYVGLIDTETWGNLGQDKRDDIGGNYQDLEDILDNRSKQCN